MSPTPTTAWPLDREIELSATDLWSKSGFADGDLLDDIIWDYGLDIDNPGEAVSEIGYFHEVLVRVAERYLVPVLPEPIVIERFVTAHNPVRVDDHRHEAPGWAFGIKGRVTVAQVVEIARELIEEWKVR